MAEKKERIDVLLVEKGLVPSREKAKSCIMAGLVFVQGEKVDKPGTLVNPAAEIRLREDALPYVSRGGFKLEKALREFSISLAGKTMVDIGASTGGFTDCALQQGAARSYAVDVGYGQLAWSLRQDPRVVCLERTNIRYVTKEQVPEKVDFISIDVSFISLEKVLPVADRLLKAGGCMVALIKPQFEAGREKVGKKGVVRDPLVHREVILGILQAALRLGLCPQGLTYSPIKGPEGNIEYLLFLAKAERTSAVDARQVEEVVGSAHGNLAKNEKGIRDVK
ncbi:MAG TPA: TlyA family RNA methyltransferase [Negativicutes bacterium]|nr:TlyA family RNA methyltransferase [Negativicutes bacterium]